VEPRGARARAAWAALGRQSGPLARALDALLGRGEWRLPFNGEGGSDEVSCIDGEERAVRHVYVPISLSELDDPALSPQVDDSRDATDGVIGFGAAACSGRRVAKLCGAFDDEFLSSLRGAEAAGLTRGSDAFAAAVWQPVNRRRFLSRGWHLDVGPGFPNSGSRTLAGDARQGVILLVLLSDCAPGAGGTALVPGSHNWSLRRIAREKSVTHEELNTLAVRTMRRATEAGCVLLPCASACRSCYSDFVGDTFPAMEGACIGRDVCLGSGPSLSTPRAAGVFQDRGAVGSGARELSVPGVECAEAEEALSGVPSTIEVAQVAGRAGDVVLLHPLLLHSGTTNVASLPRLLGNGVARRTHQGACPILARDVARLGLAV
jgi:ectoine hydroxylase-related dioxygenase (phytanoyl-CoA dioxygenase family)